MATAEDVLYLYERNSSYYFNCYQKGKIEECPNFWCNECFCFSKQKVLPLTIGNNSIKCNFNRKCYIKPGEECPICFESILNKSNAYLTCCGHSFHKSCIFKAMETKWKQKYSGKFCCPICRTSLGMDLHEINFRYKEDSNILDNLENFWYSINYVLCQPCSYGWDHSIGFDKNCRSCLKYRNTGKYL